ncbi:MAG: hypothetical protein U0350_11235 [Caldilineaceae bacterium]
MNPDFSQEELSLTSMATSEQAAQELRALKKRARDLELLLEAKRISAEMKTDPTKVIKLSEIKKRLGLHES